jgi:hypothetical protein
MGDRATESGSSGVGVVKRANRGGRDGGASATVTGLDGSGVFCCTPALGFFLVVSLRKKPAIACYSEVTRDGSKLQD